MERDVVLSNELEEVNVLRLLPPIPPVVGIVSGDGYVAYWGVEPYVEDLVLVAFLWNGNAPLEIPCYATLLEAVTNPALCDLNGVLCPETIN